MKKSSLFFLAKEPPFLYGDVHAMGGVPMVGLGTRAQKGKHGFDLSGNVSPLKLDTNPMFHAKGQYLFYPTQKGLYLGAGIGALREPESLGEATLGYQWKTKGNKLIFCEANGTSLMKSRKGLCVLGQEFQLVLDFS